MHQFTGRKECQDADWTRHKIIYEVGVEGHAGNCSHRFSATSRPQARLGECHELLE